MERTLGFKEKREPLHEVLELSYQKISFQVQNVLKQLRKELISLVMNQGFTVYRASKILNINNSTAKAIIRKYRRSGTIFMRKSEMEKQDSEQVRRKSPQDQQQSQNKQAQEEIREEAGQQPKEVQFYYFYPWGTQNCYILPNSCFIPYY